MEILLERMWLQIKGMRTMFLVPLIGYYCVIPLGAWALSASGTDYFSDALATMCYLLVPFLSTWWILLITGEAVEGNGREILLLGSGTLVNAFLFVMANVVCYLPLFILAAASFSYADDYRNLVIELVIIAFFMGGMAYFLVYVTKNLTASMYVIVLYTVVSNYSFTNEKIADVLGRIQLVNLGDVPYEGNYWLYVSYLIWGIVLFVLGERRSKRVD